MGWLGKLINRFIGDEIREVVTEIYDKYTRVSGMVCPPGFDASPVDGDKFLLVDLSNSNKSIAVGVYPQLKDKFGIGGVRIYGRDEDGNEVSEIILKNDGTISIESSLGGGLEATVLGESLRDQLQIIIDQLAQLKTDFTGWGVLAGDGGAALKGTLAAGFLLTPDPDITDILSDGVENN